jgi:hypothetical protein
LHINQAPNQKVTFFVTQGLGLFLLEYQYQRFRWVVPNDSSKEIGGKEMIDRVKLANVAVGDRVTVRYYATGHWRLDQYTVTKTTPAFVYVNMNERDTFFEDTKSKFRRDGTQARQSYYSSNIVKVGA